MRADQLSAAVRQYLLKAGIAKQGACHLFRHTAATLMLEGGADVRYIQAMLGHVSLATTQIYTHVTIAKLREVHEKTHPGRLYREPGTGPQAVNPAGPGGNSGVDDAGPKDGPGGPGDSERGPVAGDDPDDDQDSSACLA